MKKILVIGGAGFVGSHLVEELCKNKYLKITVVDNLFLGSKKNLKKVLNKIKYLKIDATKFHKIKSLFKRNSYDVVFNLATKPINYSLKNPIDGYNAQIDIVKNLLYFQKEKKIKKFIHFSTSEVYGSGSGIMNENYRCSPKTTYAAGKNACDVLIQTFSSLYNLDTVIVRPSNIYGPRQYYKNRHGLNPSLIVSAINTFKKNKIFKIQGNGKQSRDFIFVKDFVYLLVKSFDKLKSKNIYHYSSNENLSVNKITNIISKKFTKKSKIKFTKKRLGDVFYHRLCNKKIKKVLNFQLTKFEDGIDETIKYYM
jgi:UDP-glucose 4-epimerase